MLNGWTGCKVVLKKTMKHADYAKASNREGYLPTEPEYVGATKRAANH